MELLEDCRNGVALTGTMIENTEDEGCTTVFWLKAYLYRKKGKQVMRHDVEIAGEKYINNKKIMHFLGMRVGLLKMIRPGLLPVMVMH